MENSPIFYIERDWGMECFCGGIPVVSFGFITAMVMVN